ncbi:inositol monophosphatase family protein [Evansella halocellulosilytica]|uniref:inositol monophosphatase family protein n=1 Tax=Evansella halocellulosilytica TaxID=2011013 RepID=UPI000BB893E5|nr:inositol monophosphatase [Evansella halocellulosilytica]
MNKYNEEIYRCAKMWVLEAGKMLKKTLSDSLHVEYKTSAADLVTEKDRQIEKFFVEKINDTFPDHFILGEEGTASEQRNYDPNKEVVWMIDPIDGTTNFVHQKRNFTISVGIFDEGNPLIGIIYDPIADECFHTLSGNGAFLNDEMLERLNVSTIEETLISMNSLWLVPNEYVDHKKLQCMVSEVRGVRCIGSAALELAYVACGRLDASLAVGLGPWDFAAGYVLLNEVGGITTTIANTFIDPFNHSSVFSAKPRLHRELFNKFL